MKGKGMKSLKETIAALHDLGLSQQAIAEVSGVPQPTISRWSRKNPRLVNLAALDKMQKHLDSIKKQRAH
jgi:predicted XRE-type DNA-binding protein